MQLLQRLPSEPACVQEFRDRRQIFIAQLDAAFSRTGDGRFLNKLPVLACKANASGYFTWVNDAFTRITGWSRTELLSNPFITFIHHEDRARTELKYHAQIFKGDEADDFSNRFMCKDRTYIALLWDASPLSEGEICAIAKVLPYNSHT